MTATCTWRDCSNPGEHEQKAGDGEVWAILCRTHQAEMDEALKAGNAPKLLRAWTLAHGSKERFAARMMGRA